MSLIDEALKRAELEAARRDGLRGGAYPWVPEHTPKRRRRWAFVLAAVVCVGVAAGGVMWFSTRQAQEQVQSPKSRVQSSPAGESPARKMETVEVAPPPVGRPSRVSASDGEIAGPKGSEGSRQPATKPPAKGVRVRVPSVAESRPPSAAADTRPAREAAEAKTYIGEVTVPDGAKIELGGIVYSETNPVALINGKVLGPGATVEEFSIVSIQPDRVELRGRGMTIFLALK